MDETVYKIALAGFLHDIGKFAERASAIRDESSELETAFYPDEEFLNDNMDLYQPHHDGVYTHRHAVYTAAFIDHIERFLPRQFNRGEWGLGDSFMNLAAGHHKPETPMQWIIAMADRISSGFDREEFENYNKGIAIRDFKRTRLLTIFEGISIDGQWKEDRLDAFDFRYPLKELSPKNIFPSNHDELRLLDSEGASREYRTLFFNFVNSLETLSHRYNVPLWLEHFESLFMIYASHIPAASVGYVVPDVSLYDHSKATSALASAIYLYHSQRNDMNIEKIKNYEDKKFLIVSGDFYGIQNFIFTEGGSTNKASAKLIRGRSFAVSLISELAADLLCREIGLTTLSIILNAAGKFTLIAPNTKETKDKIKIVEDRINEWLIKAYYGESSFGISFVEAAGSNFVSSNFYTLWDKLSKELDKKKYTKIDLGRYGGVISDYLDQFNNGLGKKLCPFCGKRPSSPVVEDDPLLGKDENSACKICRDHIYLGTYLVKSPRIAVTTVNAAIFGGQLKEPIFGIYQVSLNVSGELNELAAQGVLLKYWDITISSSAAFAKDITNKFINGYVPVYSMEDETEDILNRLLHGEKTEDRKNELFDMIRDGTPKNFHHLAKMGLNKKSSEGDKLCGIEALGVLKADVDNLGLIFAYGFRKQSLSRLATLSRQMNHYFSIYLPFIMSTREEFKNIYTVFGGGDDLFLIGPWNRIIDFALFLDESFRKYVCGNSQISISAGISINKPGEPVLSISERSETALRQAKRNKQSITLFDEPVKWAEFEELEQIKRIIENWLDQSMINNAMLFRLNTFAIMAKQEKELLSTNEGIEKDEWECLKWRAMFRYNLIRNIGKNLRGNERERAINDVANIALWIDKYGGAMNIPVWQIIYNYR